MEEEDEHKEMKAHVQGIVAMPRAEHTFPHNLTALLPSPPAAVGKTVTGNSVLGLLLPSR